MSQSKIRYRQVLLTYSNLEYNCFITSFFSNVQILLSFEDIRLTFSALAQYSSYKINPKKYNNLKCYCYV